MDKQVTEALRGFLESKTLLERAEQANAEARELLIDTLAEAGLDEATLDEVTVKVVPAERRSFDMDKLKTHVTPAMFRRLTKPAMDTKAWDSATGKGEIPAKVVKAVVSVTNSVRVLVQPTKGADKPAKASKTA